MGFVKGLFPTYGIIVLLLLSGAVLLAMRKRIAFVRQGAELIGQLVSQVRDYLIHFNAALDDTAQSGVDLSQLPALDKQLALVEDWIESNSKLYKGL